MVAEQPTRKMLKELRNAGFKPGSTVGSHTKWRHPSGAWVSVPDGHRTNLAWRGSEDQESDRGGRAVKRYEVKVAREGRWWMVYIPELDGVTQARRVSEAELMAREYIAVTLDAELEDIAVDVHITKVGPVDAIDDRLKVIKEERERAAELERQAIADATRLAKDLTDADVPLRDVGAILGVSYQRVHQLVNS